MVNDAGILLEIDFSSIKYSLRDEIGFSKFYAEDSWDDFNYSITISNSIIKDLEQILGINYKREKQNWSVRYRFKIEIQY